MWVPTHDEAVLMYARRRATGPQRASWLEKKLTRSKMTAILKVKKSGTLLQMPWTDLNLGLSPGCSPGSKAA